jgi:hypothetical protein
MDRAEAAKNLAEARGLIDPILQGLEILLLEIEEYLQRPKRPTA